MRFLAIHNEEDSLRAIDPSRFMKEQRTVIAPPGRLRRKMRERGLWGSGSLAVRRAATEDGAACAVWNEKVDQANAENMSFIHKYSISRSIRMLILREGTEPPLRLGRIGEWMRTTPQVASKLHTSAPAWPAWVFARMATIFPISNASQWVRHRDGSRSVLEAVPSDRQVTRARTVTLEKFYCVAWPGSWAACVSICSPHISTPAQANMARMRAQIRTIRTGRPARPCFAFCSGIIFDISGNSSSGRPTGAVAARSMRGLVDRSIQWLWSRSGSRYGMTAAMRMQP